MTDRGDITVHGLVAVALKVLRAEPVRVLLPGVAVFTLAAVGDTLLVEVARTHELVAVSLLVLVVQGLGELGLMFYSGLLDRLVGAIERGHEVPDVALVIRTLPFARLIAGDLVVLGLVVAGSLVFVLPGIALFTLFLIVGPLISTHDEQVIGALRRSARLVRPHFWFALVTLTMPLLIERELTDVIELEIGHQQMWVLFVVNDAVSILFGVGIGLLVVALAERLIGGEGLLSGGHVDAGPITGAG